MGFKVKSCKILIVLLILAVFCGADSQPVYAVLQSTSKLVKKPKAVVKTESAATESSSVPNQIVVSNDASGSASDTAIIVSAVLS